MKAKSFLFAAAVTAMFTACSNDNDPVDNSQLRLSTANTIFNTRAADQNLQLEQFANNEKVGIFLVESVSGTATPSGTNVTTYTQPLEYTANGEGGLSNTQYWPTSGNGLYIYGVYPYTAASAAAAYNASSVSFEVKSDQTADTDYKASDLMTGAPSSNPVSRTDGTGAVQLTFTHLLTKVNISLTAGTGFGADDLSNAEVSILNTKLKTTFSVQSTDVTAASGDATPITVCKGTTGSAVIVPQTVSANTAFIKVVVGTGEYIYKLSDADVTFAGQSVYTYNITVNKTGLTVTSTIKAWSSIGTTSGTATLQ